MWVQIVLLLIVIAYAVQGYCWTRMQATIRKVSFTKPSGSAWPLVSVVVAIKDEEQYLPDFISLLLSQAYPAVEFIFCNDGSKDKTEDILNDINDDRVRVIHLSSGGKKSALSSGIAAAQGKWIVCTDADCRPLSAQWLKTMLINHQHNDVILGYGPYENRHGWWVDLLRYETWYIALQYMTAADNRRAYMGVGRNLAFKKSVFDEVGGYSSHQHMLSGDDDLFIASLWDTHRVGISIADQSWMISASPTSFASLWKQKRRHLTTAGSYKLMTKSLLTIQFLSYFGSYLFLLLLCLIGFPYALLCILSRWCWLWITSRSAMNTLGVINLWITLPLWDLGLLIYYGAHGLMMPFKKQDW